MVVCASMLTACAVTDVDRSVNFNAYKTFTWGPSEIKVDDPTYNSGLISKNIRTTVENELAKRGIMKDDRNADFVISFKTYTKEKQQSMGNPYPVYPFFPYRFYPFGLGWVYSYGVNYGPRNLTFMEGTLIIDITDAQTQDLVWRGSVKGNVDNVKTLERQIQKGIKAIMKKYPGTPGDRLILPGTNPNT